MCRQSGLRCCCGRGRSGNAYSCSVAVVLLEAQVWREHAQGAGEEAPGRRPWPDGCEINMKGKEVNDVSCDVDGRLLRFVHKALSEMLDLTEQMFGVLVLVLLRRTVQ